MSSPPTSPSSIQAVAAEKPGISDYELVRIVGRGSYGDVWLARSITGAWRAIKIVWRDRFTNAEPFEREFRGLKEFADVSLGESSQLALLHVGRNDAAGFFYSVMELADDAAHTRPVDPSSYVPLTLAEMRARCGRIAARECARFGVDLAHGLARLHRRGLVHRDIKPSNVIFVAGVPKLADIGLVAPSASARTFVGTEGYVPPEGPGSPGADVFALGKLLYELSTGRDRQEFPKLPDDLARLPDRGALLELNEIFLRACAASPAQRYRDAAALLADLEALYAGVSLRSRRVRVFLVRVAAVVVACGGGVWLWRAWEPRHAPGAADASVAGTLAAGTSNVTHPPAPTAEISPKSIAVLPFANLTGDPEQSYLSDGISDEILNALARERDLQVSGSTVSLAARSQIFSTAEIAKALRVAQLVEGSVQRAGSRIRINVRLTRTADGVTEILGTFERDTTNLAGLEDEVARAVAARLTRRTAKATVSEPTRKPEAYEAYLRGRALQLRQPARTDEAAGHYERAVELDPEFAMAWARLAETKIRAPWDRAAADVARAAIGRAMALHPDLPLAWTMRGVLRGIIDHNFEAGRSDLTRAEELGGRTAEWRMSRLMIAIYSGESEGVLALVREAAALNAELPPAMGPLLAGMLEHFGEFAEADRLYQQAVMTTGPAATAAFEARVLLRRKWRGAEAALRLTERPPANIDEPYWARAQLLLDLGRNSEARTLLEGAKPRFSPAHRFLLYADAGLTDRARVLAVDARDGAVRQYDRAKKAGMPPLQFSGMHAVFAAAEIVLGRHSSAWDTLEFWRRVVDWTPDLPQTPIANNARLIELYARLGETEVAMHRLQRGLAEGAILGYNLRHSIGYASLRDDPRFQELVKAADAQAMKQPDPPDL